MMIENNLSNYNYTYFINQRKKQLEVQASAFQRGKQVVTFVNDIFDHPEMNETGYHIARLPSGWFLKLHTSICNYINSKLNVKGFILDQYHTYVDDEQHKSIVNSFRGGNTGLNGIPLSELGMDYEELDTFVNDTIKSKNKLSCCVVRNDVKVDIFWIRIVRPKTIDNNPPHKDTHIERIQKNINIYLPLAGSNHNSSLPLLPGTHNEPESEYIISSSPCYICDKSFTVPAIVHRNKGLNMITPDPKTGEVMLFTPHLIHGGGSNDNTNLTRVSIEMRFFM